MRNETNFKWEERKWNEQIRDAQKSEILDMYEALGVLDIFPFVRVTVNTLVRVCTQVHFLYTSKMHWQQIIIDHIFARRHTRVTVSECICAWEMEEVQIQHLKRSNATASHLQVHFDFNHSRKSMQCFVLIFII